jgi:hypothetical protein
MGIEAREVPRWPMLAWAARVRRGSPAVELFHGPAVEVRDDWCVEGVWAGPFREGGFDRTSLVFGSGVRRRDGHVTFVSSGTTVDRVWRFSDDGTHTVSNSLPALLALSGTRLRDDVPSYPGRLGTPVTSVGATSVEVPSRAGPLECVYFHNLRWNGRSLRVAPKPEVAPRFDGFVAYRDLLRQAVADIGANARAAGRRRRLGLSTTVTRGYDSAAVSALAREAGCERAVTIESARSVLPRSDSGREVARHLGLECEEYPRDGREDPDELALWAATGSPQAANMAVFDYPRSPSVLFTGVFGGSIWTKDPASLATGLRMDDTNGLGFCEFRLHRGVVHAAVPYCGARRSWDVFDISRSEEMADWSLGGGYDRPVPRRILEEEGVPREAFGMQKNATQYEEAFLWPYRPELQESYRRYLEDRGRRAPSVGLGRVVNWMECKVLFPVRKRISEAADQRRVFRPSGTLLFQWANHELAERRRAALEDVEPRVEAEAA